MKPKRNAAADINASKPMDRCQTPAYAVSPLVPFIDPRWTIWEPAAGDGLLVKVFEALGYTVVAGDILTGQNYFLEEPANYQVQITNPAYTTKHFWFDRACELDKPFALLVPVESIGTARFQKPMKRMGLKNFQIMLLDRRVNFKMPFRGFEDGEWKSSAQFPVMWLCYKLLPELVMIGEMPQEVKA